MFTLDQLKNSAGVVRTKSLFFELSYSDPVHVIMTLKDQDLEVNGKFLPSLSRLYMALVPNDPTEYTFATTVFGSWEIWDRIRKAPQLVSHVKRWRNEAEVKIKSEAIKAIAEEMHSKGRSSFSAAKLLLDKGWLDKDSASQAKKKLEAKEQEDQDKHALSLLSEDAERLGIKIQ